MGTTIFYFTGTGNSLMVSRDLAKELGATRVISIAKVIQEPEIDLSDEYIGFVFPLYYQGVPAIVQDFIKKLPLDNTKYIFGVVTNGGGDAMSHLSKLLSKKGLRLAAGFQVSMPYNYIINNLGLDITAEARRKQQFDMEKIKVKEFAGIIQARKYIGVQKKPSLKWKLFANLPILTYARSASALGKAAKKFWTDDQCSSCGQCQKICPVNNIEIVNGKPIWHDRCQQCLACMHWCPKKAIQYGKNTLDKTRYTNPAVTLKDMIDTVGKQDDV
jgi:ferredoxin/flavodoxin